MLIDAIVGQIQKLMHISANHSASSKATQGEAPDSIEITEKETNNSHIFKTRETRLDNEVIATDPTSVSSSPMQKATLVHIDVTIEDEYSLDDSIEWVIANQFEPEYKDEITHDVEITSSLLPDTDTSTMEAFSTIEISTSLPLVSEIILPSQNKPPKVATPKSSKIKRYFDLSAHPDIAKDDLDRFMRHGHIREDTSWRYVDALLMVAFDKIGLIGELPIDETTFRHIVNLVRHNFMIGDKPKIQKVYPALFVTTMIFSTRYSDINTRNFWEPYAQLVWGLDDASQYMQVQSREHFRECRTFLSEQFEHLSFPIRNEGDVARPVFHHVLIPYYLQDDFANWILQHFQAIIDIDRPMLTQLLKSENSLRYVAPRLRQFILDADTEDTATRLIMQMAEAIALHQDGETADDILQMMTNPIEQTIWRTIADRLLSETSQKEVNRIVKPKLGSVDV